MKDLIRKILKEETDFNLLKPFITKSLEKQVNSGEIPKINFLELNKIGLASYKDEVFEIYYDFVGGPEQAFKLFKKYIQDITFTDEDIRKIGRRVYPDDHYKIKINRIYNLDYRGNRIVGNNEELEFGFKVLYGQFATSEGILTLDKLVNDFEHEDAMIDVFDNLRSEVEDYVWSVANNFCLEFDVFTSYSE